MLNRDMHAAAPDARHSEGPPMHHSLPPRSAGSDNPGPTDTSLALIRAVIEGLPEAILLTDGNDRVRLTNPSADGLFADRPVRNRQDLLTRFEPASERGGPGAGPAEGPGAASHAGPARLRLRDQPGRWFSVETFPLARQDGSPMGPIGAGFVYVLRDVSDNGDLRQEREAFLSIMSHELRTPITTIYAGSSVLARSAALSPPASQTLALDISAEAARLYDLVEDLLVIARLERRVIDPIDEPVLLQRVADSTVRILKNRAPDVTFIRAGASDPPPVRGDVGYVEQAARDLALAASRYATPGQPVTLRVDHDHDEPGEVVFRVQDPGPQLTPAERKRAFELPNGSSAGRLGANGVGPFVARHLVEAMGGRVWAGNLPDGGVEMAFALPVSPD
jgi:two-component system phosphate regulon sensor histidine kinase PhoR